MLLDGCRQHISAGVGKIICHFGPLPLFPQVYRINAGIRAADGISVYLESRQIAMFRVETDVRALGLSSEMSVPLVGLSSPVILAYRWVFADGSRYMVAPKQCMDSMRPHTVTKKVTLTRWITKGRIVLSAQWHKPGTLRLYPKEHFNSGPEIPGETLVSL
jgi:hypothetical protein